MLHRVVCKNKKIKFDRKNIPILNTYDTFNPRFRWIVSIIATRTCDKNSNEMKNLETHFLKFFLCLLIFRWCGCVAHNSSYFWMRFSLSSFFFFFKRIHTHIRIIGLLILQSQLPMQWHPFCMREAVTSIFPIHLFPRLFHMLGCIWTKKSSNWSTQSKR